MAKISVFHSEVEENCVLPGYHAASSGNFLPIFRDKKGVSPLKMGRRVCLETSVRN